MGGIRGWQFLVFQSRCWGLSDCTPIYSHWFGCFWSLEFLAWGRWLGAHVFFLTYELAGWVRRIKAQDSPRFKRNLEIEGQIRAPAEA